MFNLRFIVLQCFVLLVALTLAACGGQPTIPSDVPETVPETSEVTQPVEKAQAPQVEPEPPTIELIPRRELEEPKIAMEPLPADVPEAVEEKNPEELASKADEVKPEKKELEEVQSPSAKMEPAKAAEPAIKTRPVVSPPVVEKPSAPEPVQVSTDPNTFIVTLGLKKPPHPSLGKGHAKGFMINGVSGKQLVFERGQTYTFDVRTDAKHDVYLSRKPIGWGSAPIAEGVTGAYTYKGKMLFSPTESTPDKVYYACRNHPYMGAIIQIVNPGEKAEVVNQSAASDAAAVAPQSSAPSISSAKVKQKLMFAEMMVNSQGAKRVLASQNGEAKQLLAKAKAQLTQGREKSLVGALSEALALAESSLKNMSEASRLVPGKEAMSQLAENYKSLLAEISDYQKSYKANLKRLNKAGLDSDDARYDEKKVDKMMSDAAMASEKKDYVRANATLSKVQRIVTEALHKMLDSKTLVYDLNFETAADEYDYELKRFTEYEQLIPVAIEAKKPAPGAIKLMESFLNKARKRRDQAVAKGDAGQYGDAIAMLQQATKTVRRALRMVGVMQ